MIGRRFAIPLAAAVLLSLTSCGGTSAHSSPVRQSGRPADGGASVARSAAWPTYHANLVRDAVDRTSPRLGRLRRSWTRRLDGQVYAEPLALGNRVYAATENDSVYALNARNGRVLWRRHLGAPVRASTLPCGNIGPVSGITGTPTISGGTIYAVAFLRPGRHVLFALRLANGRVRFRRRADAPGADPLVHQQRSALSVSRGRVYVPYGGLYGDCGNYKGRVVAVGTSGRGLRHFTVGVGREGGIWGTSGAATDRHGNLFVSTGNGDSSGFDYGDSVIRLSPRLRRTGFFRPVNGGALNAGDTDLGSTGPLLLGGNRLFAAGKEGVGVLLSSVRLGGVGGQLFQRHVCDGAYGASAYDGARVYVPCENGLFALGLSGNSFAAAWSHEGFSAGPPILAGGAVWSIDTGSGVLRAYDPASGRQFARVGLGPVTHFAAPAAGGGRLFAPAGTRIVAFSGV